MIEGPRIVLIASIAVALLAAIAVVTGDLGAGIRVTARTSLFFFTLTFSASSLVALRPEPASKWLLRNRRWLGLSFAASHLGHALLIVALGLTGTLDVAATTAIGGGAGYLFLAAMAATSTDGAVRWLGRRRWRALHLAGMYLCWLIFTATYAGATVEDPRHAPALALCVLGLGLRVAAWARRRKTRRLRAGS
jgi:DMSO/TMAO reductase YedYZ heme-binding membrane subunit